MVFSGRPKPNSMDFEGIDALNASTGEIVWSYPEGGASPAVADGMVFTIGGGRVYAFREMVLGDTNNDGTITTADAVIALRMAVGAIPASKEGDVNCDDAVTSVDAMMLLQVAAGNMEI